MYRFGTARLTAVLVCAAIGLFLGGCGSLSGALRADDSLVVADRRPSDAVERAHGVTGVVGADVAAGHAAPAGRAFQIPAALLSLEGVQREDAVWIAEAIARDDVDDAAMAQAREDDEDYEDDVGEPEALDPWEPWNEFWFDFNLKLDRWVLKPVAKVYNKVMPEPFQVLISNGFDNMAFGPRLVNSVLQGKWGGAGREVSRFLLNSTAGIGGLFDPAKDYWGIPKSREDFGQTLGVWGWERSRYLILPFLEPLTLRDGVGKGVDLLFDPFRWILPVTTLEAIAIRVGDTINERSLNLDLFQGFEESVIDMYSAVRHGFLQRRQKLISE